MLPKSIELPKFIMRVLRMERTTITLPRELVEDLLEVAPAKNKTQAVTAAVQEYIKRKKMDMLKRFAGHRRWPRAAKA